MEGWNGEPTIHAEITWYTDISKTNKGTGEGFDVEIPSIII